VIENKDIFRREATSMIFGVNYYLNPAMRIMFNYTRGENEVNGDDTGQYAVRTQFAF
jgi:phosphate-selective porin OprO/OprP